MEGAFDVFKIAVAGQHDYLNPAIFDIKHFCKLYAVHDGHNNIRQYDIWRVLLNHLQRLLAVVGFPNNLKAVLFPVEKMLDALPDYIFVVDD